MPNLQQNLEWRNHNAVRNYPLTMDASGVDQTASFTIPRDFLLGLTLAVPTSFDIDPSRFYIRRLEITGVGVGLVVGYDDGAGGIDAARASIARAAMAQVQTFRLSGVGEFYDVTGHVTLGTFDSVDEQPAGRFVFTVAAGRLEPDCITPLLRGLSGVRVQNGSDVSELIVGELTLVAGANFRVTAASNAVELSAISGENLNEDCACADESVLGAPILTINQLGPDASGNIPISGNDCLQLQVEDGGIRLIDNCSKPCCGCAELEVILREQERLRELVAAVDRLAATLDAKTSQMDQVVLGSRLSDQPCLNCGDTIGTTTPQSVTEVNSDVLDCSPADEYQWEEGPIPSTGWYPLTYNCPCVSLPPLASGTYQGQIATGRCQNTLEMRAAPPQALSTYSCPDCVRLTIPAMTVNGVNVAETTVTLFKIDVVRRGIAVGYAAVALSGDGLSLQLLADNGDVATYQAAAAANCLEAVYSLSSSVGVRNWPETLQLAACE